QAEDGIRDRNVTGVQTCALPISNTFCVSKNRSATRPTKNGAATAATGFTVNGQKVCVSMPWFAMYTAIVVYHAPQMKNWRNIIRSEERRVGKECRSRWTAYWYKE